MRKRRFLIPHLECKEAKTFYVGVGISDDSNKLNFIPMEI